MQCILWTSETIYIPWHKHACGINVYEKKNLKNLFIFHKCLQSIFFIEFLHAFSQEWYDFGWVWVRLRALFYWLFFAPPTKYLFLVTLEFNAVAIVHKWKSQKVKHTHEEHFIVLLVILNQSTKTIEPNKNMIQTFHLHRRFLLFWKKNETFVQKLCDFYLDEI